MSLAQGFCAAPFDPVREAFEAALAAGDELGARFSLIVEGELVVDLCGGHADRARTRAYDQDTLSPVFSTTKAVAAIMVARLVDDGRLAYDQPVAEVWPGFGQAGKDRLTVGQALSHQGGVPGFIEPIDPELWFDWEALCSALAALAPLWPPGTRNGYHPVTYGYIAGEIFRRVDGRFMGQALRQDVAEPLGLDLFIGTPASEDHRISDLERPKSLADFGEITEARKAAFFTRWSTPQGRGGEQWRRADIPSVTGHATALALATLMARLLDGTLVSADTLAEASREWIAGPDLVLPYDMSWGAGFMRNGRLGMYGPNPATFGHSGSGGSCAFADPDRQVAGAYVMNRQTPLLLGDPRPKRLIDAAYACL